jgi:hypothetical protein
MSDRVMVPTRLLRTEWPPNDGVLPGDSYFDDLLGQIRQEGKVLVPLKVRTDWQVIDGAHRLSAARILGIEWLPVRFWTGAEWIPSEAAS